jgi:hypothetical protein
MLLSFVHKLHNPYATPNLKKQQHINKIFSTKCTSKLKCYIVTSNQHVKTAHENSQPFAF